MSTKLKKLLSATFAFLLIGSSSVFAQENIAEPPDPELNYLEAVISTDQLLEVGKSSIFHAKDSFVGSTEFETVYEWDFGDGNSNQGIEVLHSYQDPGNYQVTLTLYNGEQQSQTNIDIFAYRKFITLLTDQETVEDRLEIMQDYANRQGVYLEVIESFGSSTEFISEEVLTKKLSEKSDSLTKTSQILTWTKENAGLNAISRYLQRAGDDVKNDLSNKLIAVLDNDLNTAISTIERQFSLISPKVIIVAKEAAFNPLIESYEDQEFINILEKGGYEFEIVNDESGKVKPWKFMSYFVSFLINKGIPDNTIALLLLLPVIATVVAFMKQVVGLTTFGIYTPSIITLSFLIIGIETGLLTLIAALAIGALSRPILKRVKTLFIPKMAIVITVVSLALFLILILTTYIGLFDATFLSIAIFPMLILSTLVEKFVSAKTEKGLTSATVVMAETVLVAIIAYFIAGGEISLGFTSLKIEFIKNTMIAHPEIILLLILINFGLGRWSGLRFLEHVRFREVLRHLEE